MRHRAAIPVITAAAVILGGAFLLPVSLAYPAAAQTNPKLANMVPDSMAVTIHARITAIDPDQRQVTLTGRLGTPVTVTAGPSVRLDLLKAGDTVNAQNYRSVAFDVSQPGGIGVPVMQISGLVVGIDLSASSLDLVDPSGGPIYAVHVKDQARQTALPTLRVGDTITAVVA